MSEIVYITVENHSRIPFVNLIGPIVVPIGVKKQIAEDLVTMGFIVKIVEDPSRDYLGRLFVPVADGTTVEVESVEIEEPLELNAHSSGIDVETPKVTHDESDAETESETEADEDQEDDSAADETSYTLEEYSTLNKRQLEQIVKESARIPKESYKNVGSLSKSKSLELLEQYVIGKK